MKKHPHRQGLAGLVIEPQVEKKMTREEEHELAEFLDRCIDKNHPEYDPELDRQIRIMCPNWFKEDNAVEWLDEDDFTFKRRVLHMDYGDAGYATIPNDMVVVYSFPNENHMEMLSRYPSVDGIIINVSKDDERRIAYVFRELTVFESFMDALKDIEPERWEDAMKRRFKVSGNDRAAILN